MTLLEAIQLSSARLDEAGVSFGHGTDNAFDEAAWLVLWRMGLPLDDLSAHEGLMLSSAQQLAVEDLVTQRIQTRKPAAYLTGEAWLQGVPFTVDERCIIPRSLIAEVIADGTLDSWLPAQALRVLDICTGNGSLAVLAALAWPEVSVDATDLSADALAVTTINVERHGLQHRVRVVQGDGLEAAQGRYDLILCNPPYVNRQSMADLPAEYRAEPAMALDGGMSGGTDGMDFIRPFISKLSSHLAKGAALVLEVGHEGAHFEAAFPGLETVWLPTQTTDDQLLLITAEALSAWTKARHA